LTNPLYVINGTLNNYIYVVSADTFVFGGGLTGAYSVDGGVNWLAMGTSSGAQGSGSCIGVGVGQDYMLAYGGYNNSGTNYIRIWAATTGWYSATIVTGLSNFSIPFTFPTSNTVTSMPVKNGSNWFFTYWVPGGLNFSGTSTTGVNLSSPFYHPTDTNNYAFDTSNNNLYFHNTNTISDWTFTGTTVANAQNTTETSYAIAGGGFSAIGSFVVLGLGAVSGNTFYVSRDPATYTPYTAGVSASGLGHRAVWARNGVLIWRRGASAGKTTNEAWWTTDACATLTSRNMPAIKRWVGVVWQP
jgi:hypothetical protein